jgi:hypothetical protein
VWQSLFSKMSKVSKENAVKEDLKLIGDVIQFIYKSNKAVISSSPPQNEESEENDSFMQDSLTFSLSSRNPDLDKLSESQQAALLDKAFHRVINK